MFAICKVNKSQVRALLSVAKSLPKNFSTLSFASKKLLQNCSLGQKLKVFIKPQIRNELLNRNIGTVAAERSKTLVQKQIGNWLLLCSGMVYGAIVIGGCTRLTESGLSMVNWRFTFESYPSNEDEWMAEFKKYQQYPEYKLLKQDLTLEQFKRIWITEYVHRNWGRCVGAIYLIPAAFFWLKGYFKPKMKKRVVLFGALICLQGLLGWYMVQSGLEDRFQKESDIPRVSHYRLAAHLGIALTLYLGLTWLALDLLLIPEKITATAGIRKLRMLAHSCKGLVFLTALSGAFVAGLDAGLVYNSFPKMGDKWIPDDIFALSPKLKNFTENPTTVQFSHRILGITTLSAILITWFLSKKYPLPRRAKSASNLLAFIALCQVSLGISTLVHYVPLPLAVAHQSGSVMLLTMATWLSHELKVLKYIPK